MNTPSSLQIGLALVGWGLAVWVPASIVTFTINRRRFMRRTPVGIEEFESYARAVVTHKIESVLMIAAWFAKLGGGFYVVLGLFNLFFGK